MNTTCQVLTAMCSKCTTVEIGRCGCKVNKVGELGYVASVLHLQARSMPFYVGKAAAARTLMNRPHE
jgi:cobalamin-dependent methionine synthase I